jgi:hypothetical protein
MDYTWLYLLVGLVLGKVLYFAVEEWRYRRNEKAGEQ